VADVRKGFARQVREVGVRRLTLNVSSDTVFPHEAGGRAGPMSRATAWSWVVAGI
jgi:hypothetical protein